MTHTEVWDGWATFTCRIEEKINKRGVKVYRYVIERKFVRKGDYKIGWWNKDREKVIRRGTKHLNSHKRPVDENDHVHI